MTIDHGVLNVPLSKRGDIDRELDKYKAEQKFLQTAAEKAARAEWRQKVAEAKGLVNALSEARLVELGAPHSMTAKQTRNRLLSIASTRPDALANALMREGGDA